MEIELEENVTFNVDGEKLAGNRFVIDVIPNAITVYQDNEFVDDILNQKTNLELKQINDKKELQQVM